MDTSMSRDNLAEVVREILARETDRRAEVLTDFIVAAQWGRERKWFREYMAIARSAPQARSP